MTGDAINARFDELERMLYALGRQFGADNSMNAVQRRPPTFQPVVMRKEVKGQTVVATARDAGTVEGLRFDGWRA